MKKIIALLIILVSVVLVSGCTSKSSETLLMEYSLPSGEYPNYMGVQNVTIPNGTKTVRIEYLNLTKTVSNSSISNLNVYFLNVVPVSEQTTSNYAQNIINQKSVKINNTTVSGVLEFNSSNIKGLIIVNDNVRGVLKIYTS